MNKKLWIWIIGLVLVLGVGFGIIKASASSASANLSIEEAKVMAQNYFPGEVVEIELEKNGKRAVFEVKIVSDGCLYELKLDGDSGEVLKLESKGEANLKVKAEEDKHNNDDSQPQSTEDNLKTDAGSTDDGSSDAGQSDDNIKSDDNSQHNEKDNNNNNDAENEDDQVKEDSPEQQVLISSEAAIEIVKAELNFAGEIKEIELDNEDGRLYYEVEVDTGLVEVEMEIDAYTGEILFISSDSEISIGL